MAGIWKLLCWKIRGKIWFKILSHWGWFPQLHDCTLSDKNNTTEQGCIVQMRLMMCTTADVTVCEAVASQQEGPRFKSRLGLCVLPFVCMGSLWVLWLPPTKTYTGFRLIWDFKLVLGVNVNDCLSLCVSPVIGRLYPSPVQWISGRIGWMDGNFTNLINVF